MDMIDYYKNKAVYRADIGALNDSRILNITKAISILPPKSKILDIGCGDMYLSRLLPEYNWTGLDIDSTKAPGIVEQDITKTPYNLSSKSFDGIVCSEVLEHLFDPIAVIKESRRLLAPNGRLFVTVPNMDSFDNVFSRYQSLIFNPNNGHAVEHIRLYTIQSLVKIVEDQGFEIESYTGNSPHLSKFLQFSRSALKKRFPTMADVEVDQTLGELFPFHCPGFLCVFK